ncbi:MAG: hypothetical protein CFE38_07145 [Comamonadaceae bacterium PBBC1]|nr:MAG: hypothetical protein CFE38_07145 [Comamonadaceae bacterium PBBC1]
MMQNTTTAKASENTATATITDMPVASAQTSGKSTKASSAKAAPAKSTPSKVTAPQVDHGQAAAKTKISAPAPKSAPAPATAKKAKAVSTQAQPEVVKAKTKTAKPDAKAVKPLAKSVKPKAKAANVESVKPAKEKKVKVVRDSFTLPKTELLQIADMKKRAMALGVDVKKSELIRAGLQALSGLTDAPFKKALASVPTIKTGRPAKD